jgi:aldehyde:ferredoxin oxidoreductase
MYGWMGKILQINLSTSEIKQFSSQPYINTYLGGRGIAARLYWERVKPHVKPFDPENPLIFITGVLVGTGAPASNIVSVVSQSPSASPEGYCYGNIAGFIGVEIKKAGYDGIIIEGKASKPVYLWINNDKVEIRDASAMWGQGAYKSAELLQHYHGRDVRFITTGVAGERKVRTAVAYASHESTLSCGYGAVMGSKNLKGIAIKGTGKIMVADPGRLKELTRYSYEINKREHLAFGPDTIATGHAHLLEVIGKGACHLCGSQCIRNVYRYGKRLEGMRRCQAMEYYLPWVYGQENEPLETFFDEETLANDFSLDTFELRVMIKWLYACHKAGALTEKETGLPLSKIGTREFLVKLLHSIAYREGFGDILAEGMVRAADKISPQARSLYSHGVAPIGEYELEPPRKIIAHALLYPMEPRVFQPLVHDIGFVLVPWSINQAHPGANPITTEVVHRIARKFWGSDEAGDISSYEGKARAAVIIQNRVCLKDSLGLCDFTWPIIYSYATPDNVGDPELPAKLFAAATGSKEVDMERYGAVINNLQRSILIREGRKTPAADYPQEYHFTEPLGSAAMDGEKVPGPNTAVDMAQNKLDKKKFTGMLKEYYRLRGWDEESGVPKASTLNALGMEDIASQLNLK